MSSLVSVLWRHCGVIDPCRSPEELVSLRYMPDRLPDPRRVHGRRYPLVSPLALGLLAVPCGATTLAGIAQQTRAAGAHCVLTPKDNRKSSAAGHGDCPGARSRFSAAPANGPTDGARYAA